MASFMENLWESVFTPGTTPTLLLATNVTFGALQFLLLALLIATYSIHFVILSFLCGGLWWSINWFAAEIRAAQAKEEEAKRIRGARKGGNDEGKTPQPSRRGPGGEGEGMDSGDDTETEVDDKTSDVPPAVRGLVKNPDAAAVATGKSKPGDAPGSSATGTQTSLAPPRDDGIKKRRGMAESDASLTSTDSEWEKVEEE